ncbi:unnamed protein product, partial [Brassica oleracea]
WGLTPAQCRKKLHHLPMSSGHEMHGGCILRDEDLDVPDTITIGSAYDRYLQNVQTPSMPSSEVGPRNGVAMDETSWSSPSKWSGYGF